MSEHDHDNDVEQAPSGDEGQQAQQQEAQRQEPVDRGIQPVSFGRRKMSPGVLAIVVVTVLALLWINYGAFTSGDATKEKTASQDPDATALPEGGRGMSVAPLTIPEPVKPEPAPKPEPAAKRANAAVLTSGIQKPLMLRMAPRRQDKNEVTPAERKMKHGLFAYKSGSAETGSSRSGAATMTSGIPGVPSMSEALTKAHALYGGNISRGGTGVSMSGSGTSGGKRASLKSNMQTTAFKPTVAKVLPHPRMTLTKGHFIPCVLETAISSDLSGMVACRITEDVYSTTGDVVLLEKGTRLIGQYKGGMKQGQARLFIVWTRAETPEGVIISLQSPAVGRLGKTGIMGHIDRHFWSRFGAAMLISVLGDVTSYVAEAAQEDAGNDTTITFGNTRQAASDLAKTVLEHRLGIPPTLTVNQGELIYVFVARDLDFSTVYDLEPVE